MRIIYIYIYTLWARPGKAATTARANMPPAPWARPSIRSVFIISNRKTSN